MLDKSFDIVRKQLLNPDQQIYPPKFCLTPPISSKQCGVYIIEDAGFESILSIFQLKTKVAERIFGVILPLLVQPVEKVIEGLHQKLQDAEQSGLALYSTEGNNYLSNLGHINKLNQWLNKRAAVNNA